jgi:hypothetical protein
MEALTRAWDGTPDEQAFAWELRRVRRSGRCGFGSHPPGWESRVTVDGELLRSQAYRDEVEVRPDVDEVRRQFTDKGWQENGARR